VNLFSHEGLDSLVATYGYLAVALGVGLESRGLPIPGETILVVAAVYAAAHAGLNIWLIVLAASVEVATRARAQAARAQSMMPYP
jgi:membrane protein DedA with SNARE-associated domain